MLSKDDITLIEQEKINQQKQEDTVLKSQQQNFAMSTVFKAIDELRITRGEDAALEFSTILSHYHLNGVNDTSFNQREQPIISKVTKKGSKGDTQNDSLTQLLDSMTKPAAKGEEKKQKATVIKEKEVKDVLLNSIETAKRKRKKAVANEDEEDLFEVKKSESIKKKKKKAKE